MPKLSEQQKTFAAAYFANGFCGGQAAVTAGYSPKNADSLASKLLRKSQVKAEIDRLSAQIQEKSTVEAAEVIQELRKIAFVSFPGRVNNGDRLRALELLGKYLALFTDRNIIAAETAVPSREITPEEEAALREAGLAYVKARAALPATGQFENEVPDLVPSAESIATGESV